MRGGRSELAVTASRLTCHIDANTSCSREATRALIIGLVLATPGVQN